MASSNPYRYAGYQYDEVTGLYYLMARYYDASIGRFITRDTFHGFEDNPLSLNQFSYTENNPVGYIDPSGYYRTNFSTGPGGGGNGFFGPGLLASQ
jgi:RHS repeat-associated protein